MMLVMKVNDNAHYDDDNDDDDDNDYEITKSNDDYAEAHLFFFCIRIHHNCPQHLDQKNHNICDLNIHLICDLKIVIKPPFQWWSVSTPVTEP